MSDSIRSTRDLVQAHFDVRDRAMLDALAERMELPRTEVLRIALRRLAAETLSDRQPGASLTTLIGALDGASDLPSDLASRHDEYLYAAPDPAATSVTERSRRPKKG
jgi:hypothetical protein